MVYPFGWPRPLWISLMGRQPLETDLVSGIVFLTICNVVLYGTISYVALFGLRAVRHRPADSDSPPPPHLSPQV